MERVRVRQLQQAVVLYWVEVEVPEGLSPAEKSRLSCPSCDHFCFHDYDPNEVMEKLSSEDLIDVAWAVLEGGDPLAVALEIVSDMEDEDEG